MSIFKEMSVYSLVIQFQEIKSNPYLDGARVVVISKVGHGRDNMQLALQLWVVCRLLELTVYYTFGFTSGLSLQNPLVHHRQLGQSRSDLFVCERRLGSLLPVYCVLRETLQRLAFVQSGGQIGQVNQQRQDRFYARPPRPQATRAQVFDLVLTRLLQNCRPAFSRQFAVQQALG